MHPTPDAPRVPSWAGHAAGVWCLPPQHVQLLQLPSPGHAILSDKDDLKGRESVGAADTESGCCEGCGSRKLLKTLVDSLTCS